MFSTTWIHRLVFYKKINGLSRELNTLRADAADLCAQGKQAVLMSVITGDAVTVVRDMEDKEVAGECLKVLRELFKEQVTQQSHDQSCSPVL